MTDYEDYALAYACSEFDAQGRCLTAATYVYVMGRDISISPAHRRVVDNTIASLCLNMTNYFTTPYKQREFNVFNQVWVHHLHNQNDRVLHLCLI